jgi:hypothetical protein
VNRLTNLKPLRPSRKLFCTDTVEPMRRHVQDWAIAAMALVAWAVIARFCQ